MNPSDTRKSPAILGLNGPRRDFPKSESDSDR